MMVAGAFSNAEYFLVLREEKHDKQKVQNDIKTPNSSTLFQILIQTSNVLS